MPASATGYRCVTGLLKGVPCCYEGKGVTHNYTKSIARQKIAGQASAPPQTRRLRYTGLVTLETNPERMDENRRNQDVCIAPGTGDVPAAGNAGRARRASGRPQAVVAGIRRDRQRYQRAEHRPHGRTNG